MATLTLRLPEDINQRLDTLALKTGRTKTFYAREALEQYLEDMEDVYLAQAALTRQRKSGLKTISHEELGAKLGLLDD